ncbi:MAG: WbqC family protein [Cytophagaceae bacterium]
MESKTVVILQSNYIPWKGYFDLINLADEFIFYDDVQYTTADWRNRNRIKTPDGLRWLTIPVGDDINRNVNEVEFAGQGWKRKHKDILIQHYRYAKHFPSYRFLLDMLYDNQINNLSAYNQYTIREICKALHVSTRFSNSTDYKREEGKTGRLVGMLKQAEATHFICGPAARSYLDEEMIRQAGIHLSYFDYSGYPQYPQLYGDFSHEVSALDLIFNMGDESARYLKTFKTKS